mmetsp:Transcript_40946/g.96267  ORF Transcript_40946/g.96267 Transcript_40946/m.96267 type:complete len:264 (+) Transcript_40946:566-1357(+)
MRHEQVRVHIPRKLAPDQNGSQFAWPEPRREDGVHIEDRGVCNLAGIIEEGHEALGDPDARVLSRRDFPHAVLAFANRNLGDERGVLEEEDCRLLSHRKRILLIPVVLELLGLDRLPVDRIHALALELALAFPEPHAVLVRCRVVVQRHLASRDERVESGVGGGGREVEAENERVRLDRHHDHLHLPRVSVARRHRLLLPVDADFDRVLSGRSHILRRKPRLARRLPSIVRRPADVELQRPGRGRHRQRHGALDEARAPTREP